MTSIPSAPKGVFFYLVFSKAADTFLRVRGRQQIMQVLRGRQSFRAEPLQNPAVGGCLGGNRAAAAFDGGRKAGVREDLGVWDTPGLAVGERVPLTSGGSILPSSVIQAWRSV